MVALIQYAAIITRIETLDDDLCKELFPAGIPLHLVVQILTDNMSTCTWINKVTSQSHQAQGLLLILSELIQCHPMNINSEHVAGVDNGIADDLSRADLSLPVVPRYNQLITKHPFLKTYDVFLPAPGFMRNLIFRLFTTRSMAPPSLPKHLGQFVPTESIISNGLN